MAIFAERLLRVNSGAAKTAAVATCTGGVTTTNQVGGKLTETVWFVPALANYVKLDYQDADAAGRLYSRDSWELTTYAHKGAPPLAAVMPVMH